MSLVPSLLQAIVRVDGEALVMHAGDKPYVVSPTGQVDLASRGLTLEAVNGIVSQLLPLELQNALDEFGAVQHELAMMPEFPGEHFTVVAARGGDDVWVEIRRRRIPEDDRVPDEFFAANSVQAVAAAAAAAPPSAPAAAAHHADAVASVRVEEDNDELPIEMLGFDTPPAVASSARPGPLAPAGDAIELDDDLLLPDASHMWPGSPPPSAVAQEPLTPPTASMRDDGEVIDIDVDAVSADEAEVEPEPVQQPVPMRPAATVATPAATPAPEVVAAAQAERHVESPSLAKKPAAAAPPAARKPAAPVESPVAARKPAAPVQPAVAAKMPAAPAPPPPAAHKPVAPAMAAVAAEKPAVAATAPVQTPQPPVDDESIAASVDAPQPEAPSSPAPPAAPPSYVPAAAAIVPVPDMPFLRPLHSEPPAVSPVDVPVYAAPAGFAEPPAAAPPAASMEPPASVGAASSAMQAPDFVGAPAASTELPSAVPAAPPAPASYAPPIAASMAPPPPRAVAPPPVGRSQGESPSAVVLNISRNPIRSEMPPPAVEDPTLSGLERLLRVSWARGASTLYLSSDSRPSVRVDGELQLLDGEPVHVARDVESLLLTLMPERSHEALRTGAATEWICDLEGVGRVRCMSFRDQRGPGGVFRLMPTRSISADQLGLPKHIQALAIEPEGLVLVAGPRSSGKRTTMSAFVDLMNRTRRDHIITIEREINIQHERGQSFISQREVRGSDEEVLAAARAAMREDPDVLVIEELRTGALMNVALEAAAAGRLVVGGFTAHTATGAIDRIIDLYAPEYHRQVQMALADSMRGVIAQALLRKIGGGRLPARELLLNTPAVSSAIAEGKTSQLPMAIEGGRRYGMMPLNDALVGLVQNGSVEPREAYRHSPDRPGFLAALNRQGLDTSFVERLANG